MRRSNLVALVVVPIALSAGAAGALNVETIALEGGAALGTGRFYDRFEPPFLNDIGQVAYRSSLRDEQNPPTDDYDTYGAIFWGVPSAPWLVVQEGDAAPGVPGATFQPDELGGLNGSGQITFEGTLDGAGVTDADEAVVYGGPPHALILAARAGSAVPGIPGVTIGESGLRFPAVIDASGQLLFWSELTVGVGGVTFSNASMLLGGAPGSVGVVAREGDQVSGAPAGTRYSDFSGFVTMTDGGTAYFESGGGFHAGPLTSPIMLMQQRDFVGPDLPGVRMSSLGGSLNDAGQGIFQASLEIGSGGITSANNVAVMTGAPGNLNVLLQRGQPVPGAAGLTFFFGHNVTLGADGTFTLRAELRDAANSPRTAFLVGTQSDIRALAVSGEQAPGLPVGALFGNISTGGTSNITDDGEMAFTASLRTGSGGVTSSNSQVLYWVDGDGAMHPILRRGDSLEVAAGDFREVTTITIRTVSPSSNALMRQSTNRHAVNESGQIAFHATFTDGSSGIFLASTSDPLPSSCSDGLDDDGDGLVDFGEDPACMDEQGVEASGCQNGLDDDGDGKIDFDGGASWNGGTAIADADPHCVQPWRQKETATSCGLGAELAIALALLPGARRRSWRRNGRRVVN